MFRKRERNASYEKILQKRNYFITGWDDDALYHTGTACHGTGESVYIHFNYKVTDDSVGYSDISFSRASPVWKCHCILAVSRLRSISHADNSHLSLSRVDIRRERHWRVITLSSISAMSSQLPCLTKNNIISKYCMITESRN